MRHSGQAISGGNGIVANGQNVGFNERDVTFTAIDVETDPDGSPQCDFSVRDAC